MAWYSGMTDKDPYNKRVIWAKDLSEAHKLAEKKRNKKTEYYCWLLPYKAFIESYGL
jgi:hypothetical protein